MEGTICSEIISALKLQVVKGLSCQLLSLIKYGFVSWWQDGGTFPDHNEFKKVTNSKEALILSRFDTF